MVVGETGKFAEDVYMLGSLFMPIYLVDGENPVIFDAGIDILGSLYVSEIKKKLGNRQPAYCMLTHSHFDHCGSVSYLKKHFPSMKIVSSDKIGRVLQQPRAVELIKQLNRVMEPMMPVAKDYPAPDRFEPFEIDLPVKDGDTINLSSDLNVIAIETPGHTRDCMSYYIPEKKMLFSSEAFGIGELDFYIQAEFLVDYDMYYNSMKKMTRFETDVLCIGHHNVFIGDDAVRYMNESIYHCEKFYVLVKKCLEEENGDIEKVKIRIKAIEYDNSEKPKQPEPAYLLNLEARVKAVKKHVKESSR